MLNSLGLNLHDAHVSIDASKEDWQKVSSIASNTQKERVAFHLASPIPAQTKAKLKLNFDGLLTDSMVGYFRSSWEDEGEKKYYGVTQFEVRPFSSCR